MKIGSLFSGIGGLELGLERAGVGRVVWQVERDGFCRSVLARHWPLADRTHWDVRKVGADNLELVDVLCGGFPCQDVSSAGKHAGLSGKRSGLWYEFRRIAEELRPRAVVVENVASGAWRWLCPVREGLHELGYRTRAIGISAEDVGAPHRRKRIFVLALLPDPDDAQELPLGGPEEVALLPERPDLPGWDGPEPPMGRVADGVPRGMDRLNSARLRALGNAVVPRCAELAGRTLLEWMDRKPA